MAKIEKLFTDFKKNFDPKCFASSMTLNLTITTDSELDALIQELCDICSGKKFETLFTGLFIIAIKRRVTNDNKIKNVDIKVAQALEKRIKVYAERISRDIETSSTETLCKIIETIKFIAELYSFEILDGEKIHQLVTRVLPSRQNEFLKVYMLTVVKYDVLKRADNNHFDMLLQNMIFDMGLCDNDVCGITFVKKFERYVKRLDSTFDFKPASKLKRFEVSICMDILIASVTRDISRVKFYAQVYKSLLLAYPSCDAILSHNEQKLLDSDVPDVRIYRIVLEAFHCEIIKTSVCKAGPFVEELIRYVWTDDNDFADTIFLMSMSRILMRVGRENRELFTQCMAHLDTIQHKRTKFGIEFPSLNDLSEVDEKRIHPGLKGLIEQLTDENCYEYSGSFNILHHDPALHSKYLFLKIARNPTRAPEFALFMSNLHLENPQSNVLNNLVLYLCEYHFLKQRGKTMKREDFEGIIPFLAEMYNVDVVKNTFAERVLRVLLEEREDKHVIMFTRIVVDKMRNDLDPVARFARNKVIELDERINRVTKKDCKKSPPKEVKDFQEFAKKIAKRDIPFKLIEKFKFSSAFLHDYAKTLTREFLICSQYDSFMKFHKVIQQKHSNFNEAMVRHFVDKLDEYFKSKSSLPWNEIEIYGQNMALMYVDSIVPTEVMSKHMKTLRTHTNSDANFTGLRSILTCLNIIFDKLESKNTNLFIDLMDLVFDVINDSMFTSVPRELKEITQTTLNKFDDRLPLEKNVCNANPSFKYCIKILIQREPINTVYSIKSVKECAKCFFHHIIHGKVRTDCAVQWLKMMKSRSGSKESKVFEEILVMLENTFMQQHDMNATNVDLDVAMATALLINELYTQKLLTIETHFKMIKLISHVTAMQTNKLHWECFDIVVSRCFEKIKEDYDPRNWKPMETLVLHLPAKVREAEWYDTSRNYYPSTDKMSIEKLRMQVYPQAKRMLRTVVNEVIPTDMALSRKRVEAKIKELNLFHNRMYNKLFVFERIKEHTDELLRDCFVLNWDAVKPFGVALALFYDLGYMDFDPLFSYYIKSIEEAVENSDNAINLWTFCSFFLVILQEVLLEKKMQDIGTVLDLFFEYREINAEHVEMRALLNKMFDTFDKHLIFKNPPSNICPSFKLYVQDIITGTIRNEPSINANNIEECAKFYVENAVLYPYSLSEEFAEGLVPWKKSNTLGLNKQPTYRPQKIIPEVMNICKREFKEKIEDGKGRECPRKTVGLVKLIGELYIKQLIGKDFMLHCVEKVVEKALETPNLLNLLCYNNLVTTIKKTMIERKELPKSVKTFKENTFKIAESLALIKKTYTNEALDEINPDEVTKSNKTPAGVEDKIQAMENGVDQDQAPSLPLPKDINNIDEFRIWLSNATFLNRSLPDFTKLASKNLPAYSEIIIDNLSKSDNVVPILVIDGIQFRNKTFVQIFTKSCVDRLQKMITDKEEHYQFVDFMMMIANVYNTILNDFTLVLVKCVGVMLTKYTESLLGTLLLAKVLKKVGKKFKEQNVAQFYHHADIFYCSFHDGHIPFKSEEQVKVVTDYLDSCNEKNDKIYTLKGRCNPSLYYAIDKILKSKSKDRYEKVITSEELKFVHVTNGRECAKFFFENAARSYAFNTLHPVKFTTFLKDWLEFERNREEAKFHHEVMNAMKISFHAQHISKDPDLPSCLKVGTAVLIKEFYPRKLIDMYDMETFVKTLICHEMTNGNGVKGPVYEELVKYNFQGFLDKKEPLAHFVLDNLRSEVIFSNNNISFDRKKWLRKAYEHVEWKKEEDGESTSKEVISESSKEKKRSSPTGAIPKNSSPVLPLYNHNEMFNIFKINLDANNFDFTSFDFSVIPEENIAEYAKLILSLAEVKFHGASGVFLADLCVKIHQANEHIATALIEQFKVSFKSYMCDYKTRRMSWERHYNLASFIGLLYIKEVVSCEIIDWMLYLVYTKRHSSGDGVLVVGNLLSLFAIVGECLQVRDPNVYFKYLDLFYKKQAFCEEKIEAVESWHVLDDYKSIDGVNPSFQGLVGSIEKDTKIITEYDMIDVKKCTEHFFKRATIVGENVIKFVTYLKHVKNDPERLLCFEMISYVLNHVKAKYSEYQVSYKGEQNNFKFLGEMYLHDIVGSKIIEDILLGIRKEIRDDYKKERLFKKLVFFIERKVFTEADPFLLELVKEVNYGRDPFKDEKLDEWMKLNYHVSHEGNMTVIQLVTKFLKYMNMDNIHHIADLMGSHPSESNFDRNLDILVNEVCENIHKVPLIFEMCKLMAANKEKPFKMIVYKKHFKIVIEKRFEDFIASKDSHVSTKELNLAKFTAILSNNALLNKNVVIALCKRLTDEIFLDRLDLVPLLTIMMGIADKETFSCESRMAVVNLKYITEDIQRLLNMKLPINRKSEIVDILRKLDLPEKNVLRIAELDDEENKEEECENLGDDLKLKETAPVEVYKKFDTKAFKNILTEWKYCEIDELTAKLEEFKPLSSSCVEKIVKILFGEYLKKFDAEMLVKLAVIIDQVDGVKDESEKASNDLKENQDPFKPENQAIYPIDSPQKAVEMKKMTTNFINSVETIFKSESSTIQEFYKNKPNIQDFKSIFTQKVLFTILEFFDEKAVKDFTQSEKEKFEGLMKISAELFNENWVEERHVYEIFELIQFEVSKINQTLFNKQYFVKILNNFITTCAFKLMRCDDLQVLIKLQKFFENPENSYTFHDKVQHQEIASKIEKIVKSGEVNLSIFTETMSKSNLNEFMRHFENFNFKSLDNFYQFSDVFIEHASIGDKVEFSKAAEIFDFHQKRHLILKCSEKLQNGGKFYETLGIVDFISQLYIDNIANIEDIDKCLQMLLLENNSTLIKILIGNVAAKINFENSALLKYYFEVIESKLDADELQSLKNFQDGGYIDLSNISSAYESLMIECLTGNPDAIALKFLKNKFKFQMFVKVLFKFLVTYPEFTLKYVQLCENLSKFGGKLQESLEDFFTLQRRTLMNMKMDSAGQKKLLNVLIFIVHLHHIQLISDDHFHLWIQQQLLIKLKCENACDFYKNLCCHMKQRSSMMEILCENLSEVIGEHLEKLLKKNVQAK